MIIANGGTLVVLVKQFGLHPFGRPTIRVGLFAVLCFGLVGVVVRLGMGATFVGAYVAGAIGTAAYSRPRVALAARIGALEWKGSHRSRRDGFRGGFGRACIPAERAR